MATFRFKARDSHGQLSQGTIDSENQVTLDAFFSRKQLIPIHVQPIQNKTSWALTRPLPATDLIAFTRQLSAAYGAGIGISEALDLLVQTSANPKFAAALKDIVGKIRSGGNLSESFGYYPHYFGEIYVALLKCGELTGNLETVLDYQANLLEKELEYKERLRSAFLYPKLVLGMMGIASFVIVTFVIPQFAKFYDKFDAALPLPTRVLVLVANAVNHYWWVGILLSIALGIGWRKALKNEQVVAHLHRFLIRLPIFGSLFLKMDLAQFCTVFGMLLKAGLRVTEAAPIALKAIHNRHIRFHLEPISKVVESGGTIARAVSDIPWFPPLVASMIRVGEESSQLDSLLTRIAAIYERETDLFLKRLPTILEPIILGTLFFLVLFLALAVYLPLWKMAGLTKGRLR